MCSADDPRCTYPAVLGCSWLHCTCIARPKWSLHHCPSVQVNKNTKQAQQREAKAAPSYADVIIAAADARKRWSEYTLHFDNTTRKRFRESECCHVQVNKNTTQAQQRKAKAAPSYADDTNAAADAPKRWSDYTVQFEFPEPTELPPPLIQLNDVSFQYPGRDDFGLKDLNIGVDMGSRVAIVGPNGAGKTTLMNLLSG